MINNTADSFELLRNRDLMLRQWKLESQSNKETERCRKAQFLQALKSFELADRPLPDT